MLNNLHNKIEKLADFLNITSIKKKLIFSYLVVILPISLLLLSVIAYSLRLNIQYSKILSNFSSYNHIHNSLNYEIKELFLNISEQKKYDKQQQEKLIKQINDDIEDINYDINNQEISSQIEIIRRTTKSFRFYITEINNLIETKATFEERKAKLTETTEIASLIKDNLQYLMAVDLNSSQKDIQKIQKDFYYALTIIIVSFLIMIVSCIIFLSNFTRKIVGKIITIADNANKLASGKLDLEEIIFKTNDEFKILAASFNQMKNNIKDYISQLSNSEKRISSILDGMYDCVITTDEHGIILSANNAVNTVFGYEIFEILEKNIDILIPSVANSLIFNTSKFENNIYDGKFEFVGLKRDSSNFPVEIGLSQIKQDEHKIFIFVIHDITQHKEVERMKNEFVSMVSHELRTPLTSIKGALDLMMSDKITQLPETAYKLAEISHNNSTRLINLINDILDIEKICAGKMDFYYEIVELSSLIKQTVAANHPIQKQYGINFEINDNLPEFNVNVDKNRIIQVITNLLSNSAKYSPAEGKVEINLFKHNDLIRTTVKNYGPPIPDEFKEKIFQKFTQEDSSTTRKNGGTGLGLNICKNIIENMNGIIDFESSEEETVFYFDLPEYIE
jgi:PAS domain S-box-containing protein